MANENDHPQRSPLKRRWLLNFGLIGIVALLALAVLYKQLGDSQTTAVLLTPVRADEVSRVELRHTGRSNIVLQRDAANGPESGFWRMSEPVVARVNTFNVRALLDLLSVSVVELPYDLERLAAYGLDKPATEIRFNDQLVRFGGNHPFEPKVYAQFGKHIYLVPTKAYRVATFAYSSFIDTQLLAPGRTLSAIELPDFRLEHKNGTWQRKPPLATLSADDIAQFVEQWRHARALTVERAQPGRAIKRITLRFADGPPLRIDVTAEQPELVLRRADEGLGYHFPAAVAEQLLRLAPTRKN